MHNNTPGTKWLSWTYVITGIVGAYFSVLLTLERMALVQNPSYTPPCSIDPFISCGTVMKTAQASLFGFPNSFIGIVGFTVVTTIGFALLANASFSKWFWRALGIGVALALIFIFWLYYQSVYVIHALCPYCMVVWAVTIPLFVSTWFFLVRNKLIALPKRLSTLFGKSWGQPFFVVMLLYLFIILSILIVYWDYWRELL